MGMFTNFIANTQTVDVSVPIGTPDHHTLRQLNYYLGRLDKDVPIALAARDEVISIAANAAVSGNFTITVTLQNGEEFTTASILYNATAGTIESAIDSAATTASVAGWTNGDISVSGGAANSAPVVLTFDGTSVTNKNHTAATTDVDLSDGTPGIVSTTTDGQPDRSAMAILLELGYLTGAPEAYRVEGSGTLALGDRTAPNFPSDGFITDMINDIGYEEEYDFAAVVAGLS